MVISFKDSQKNKRLTKYDELRGFVINNYLNTIEPTKKKRLKHNQQTILTEH